MAAVRVHPLTWASPLTQIVLRIAGNVLGAERLGSMHYALKHLADSLMLIVVLGRSKCGAVQAAVLADRPA